VAREAWDLPVAADQPVPTAARGGGPQLML
jgi:hypothetical protein